MVECLAAGAAPSQGGGADDTIRVPGLLAEEKVARHHSFEDGLGKHPNCGPRLLGLARHGGAGPKGKSVCLPVPQPQQGKLPQSAAVQHDREEKGAGGTAASSSAAALGRGSAPSFRGLVEVHGDLISGQALAIPLDSAASVSRVVGDCV